MWKEINTISLEFGLIIGAMRAMEVGCKNASSVRMVAMAVSVMLMMLMPNCVEEAAAAAAASVEEEMELISFFSPPKSMAVGLGEQLVMAYDQGDGDFVEEITRRMLAGSDNIIGYKLLKKDNTPCSKNGHGYYDNNCNKAGSKPDPYRRSCGVQAKCARGN